MSKKHPTPWRLDLNKDYPETTDWPILDANGYPVVQTDAGVYPPDNETAKQIVEAVNEYAELNKVAASLQRSRSAVIKDNNRLRDELNKAKAALIRANKYGMEADAENGKLRDLVRRMLPLAEIAQEYANAEGETIKGICALKGVDSSMVDAIRAAHANLLREAREAIGEGDWTRGKKEDNRK